MTGGVAKRWSWVKPWVKNDRRRLAIDHPEAWVSRKLLWVAAAMLLANPLMLFFAWLARKDVSLAAGQGLGDHPIYAFSVLSGLAAASFGLYCLTGNPALQELSKKESRFTQRLCLIIGLSMAIQPMCGYLTLAYFRSPPEGDLEASLRLLGEALKSFPFVFGLGTGAFFLIFGLAALSSNKVPQTLSTGPGRPNDGGFENWIPDRLLRLDHRLAISRPLIRYSQWHLVLPIGIAYLAFVGLLISLAQTLPFAQELGSGDPSEDMALGLVLRSYLATPLLVFAGTRVFLLNSPFSRTAADDLKLAALDFTSFSALAIFYFPRWELLFSPVALGFAAGCVSILTGFSFLGRYAIVAWQEASSWRARWLDVGMWSLLVGTLFFALTVVAGSLLATITLGSNPSNKALFGAFFVPGVFLAIAATSFWVRKLYYEPRYR